MEDLPLCDICKDMMDEGYIIDDGAECYCSTECLNKKYSDIEYENMYKEGIAYWTMF